MDGQSREPWAMSHCSAAAPGGWGALEFSTQPRTKPRYAQLSGTDQVENSQGDTAVHNCVCVCGLKNYIERNSVNTGSAEC